MSERNAVILVGLCLALAACDGTPTSDMTAPESKVVTNDARAVGSPARSIVHRNGQVSVTAGGGAGLTALRAAPSATVAGTTQCDLGDIEPELDANGDPIPDQFEFPPPLPSGTYESIEVPPDAVCVLDGVTVIQSVTAFAGARLFIHSSEIGENVVGLSATVIQVGSGTQIAGDMDMQNASDDLTLPFATCAVSDATIDGNLSCTNSNPGSPVVRSEGGDAVTIGGSVNLADNFILPGHVQLLQNIDIGGNADVNDNTGGGYKEVSNNRVAQKLSCKKNDLPFVGGPNVANKSKGQCF